MSVLIKGMKMPKDCAHCSFQGFGGRMNERILCMLTGTNDYINQQSKFADCPLIEVPPHGRLIDADEVMRSVNMAEENGRKLNPNYDREWVRHCIGYARLVLETSPTIIPADKDGKR